MASKYKQQHRILLLCKGGIRSCSTFVPQPPCPTASPPPVFEKRIMIRTINLQPLLERKVMLHLLLQNTTYTRIVTIQHPNGGPVPSCKLVPLCDGPRRVRFQRRPIF